MKTGIEERHKIEKVDNLRPYYKPKLTTYGEMRDVTLGGSPGLTDSGDSGVKQPPAFSGNRPDIFGPP